MTSETPEPRFTIGQRVRLVRDPQATGRVTGTWQYPDGGFFPPQPGVDVTMDNRFSPAPVPVRYHVLGKDFEPVPDDYLDDSEALDHVTSVIRDGVPGDLTQARLMLAEIKGVLRRNDRISGQS